MIEIDCRKCQNLLTIRDVATGVIEKAVCKCYGPADKAPAACAADRFKNYRPMRTDDEYKPGMDVWCLERNTNDEAVNVGHFVFLAKIQAAVIVCPFFYDGTDELDTLLSVLYEETRDADTVELCVFPAGDCYPAEGLAEEALADEKEEG